MFQTGTPTASFAVQPQTEGRTAAQPSASNVAVLLVATQRWANAGHLALRFRDAGCQVHLLVPKGHPAARICKLDSVSVLSSVRPVASLESAVGRLRPAIVIPCDDRAILLVQQIPDSRRFATHEVPRMSTAGDAETVALGYKSLRELCGELGVIMPEGRVASLERDVTDFGEQHGYPVVLKRTGTYGGLGVRIAKDATEASRFWHELHARPRLLWVAWRAAVERNYLPLLDRLRSVWRAESAEISVQEYIEGVPANCSLSAWRGELLATFNVIALQTLRDTGPATVVQVVEQPEMNEAARRIANRLKVDGLWGLDFLIENGSGRAYLLEVNPRATPSSGLRFHGAASIVDSLAKKLGAGRTSEVSAASRDAGGGRDRRDGRVADRIVVHFPGEWSRDPASRWLSYPHHNVPWSEPAFMRACLARPYEDSGLVARLRNRLKGLLGH